MTTEEKERKPEAVWNVRIHEIWFDIAGQQVKADNINGIHLSKEGLELFMKNFN